MESTDWKWFTILVAVLPCEFASLHPEVKPIWTQHFHIEVGGNPEKLTEPEKEEFGRRVFQTLLQEYHKHCENLGRDGGTAN
ncbi:MAG: hypothetical protein IT165_06570 [Bryobacterales bacterium]|nr:hypothetical protein [Bryobacterales bacterium]